MQTHTPRHTHLVYLQGTLPHSKEVITAHFLSLWELHRGQGILRFVRDRQTDRQTERSVQAIDTVSYLRLTIVSHMENIVQIYKDQGVKCIFITLKQEKKNLHKTQTRSGRNEVLNLV